MLPDSIKIVNDVFRARVFLPLMARYASAEASEVGCSGYTNMEMQILFAAQGNQVGPVFFKEIDYASTM
jgi:hypothetical protein